jgi:hypothetical protein
VEIALREWPGKSQAEIAAQVGCAKSYVAGIKKDIITSDIVTRPATRKDSLGRNQPTTYATARTPTSVTFNPVLDGGGRMSRKAIL